jgi:hypothetical protein
MKEFLDTDDQPILNQENIDKSKTINETEQVIKVSEQRKA